MAGTQNGSSGRPPTGEVGEGGVPREPRGTQRGGCGVEREEGAAVER